MSRPTPDAYLVQAVAKGDKVWEHRWYVPRWGDPDPSALHDTTYTIHGKEHPELGTYRVTPFYAALPAQGIDLGQQQDAARWRWVREQSGVTVSVEEADDDGDMAFVSGHTPEELDAAIDGQRDAAPGVGNG